MKVLVLYRPDSEYASDVEAFVDEFQRRHSFGNGKKIELQSVNTRDGASTASLYDIMAYPSILALADDGSLISSWIGMPLPLMDEVAGYTYG